jgi:hypothetical protein
MPSAAESAYSIAAASVDDGRFRPASFVGLEIALARLRE